MTQHKELADSSFTFTSNAYSAVRNWRRSGFLAFISQQSQLYFLCPLNDITCQCQAKRQTARTANQIFHMAGGTSSRMQRPMVWPNLTQNVPICRYSQSSCVVAKRLTYPQRFNALTQSRSGACQPDASRHVCRVRS